MLKKTSASISTPNAGRCMRQLEGLSGLPCELVVLPLHSSVSPSEQTRVSEIAQDTPMSRPLSCSSRTSVHSTCHLVTIFFSTLVFDYNLTLFLLILLSVLAHVLPSRSLAGCLLGGAR
jgi:hypothetical protein